LEAFFGEALEGIGVGAGFEGAAAEQVGAGGFSGVGGGEELVAGFDGTGTGDDGELGGADGVAGNFDDGVLAFDLAGDELVGSGDGEALGNALAIGEEVGVEGGLVAGNADGDAGGAGDAIGGEAQFPDAAADGIDLVRGGVVLHDNEHRGCLRGPG